MRSIAGPWVERCKPFGKYQPLSVFKPVPGKKGHNIVSFAVTNVTMLDRFFWVMRGRGKWGAMWLAKTPQGLWGVNAGLFIFSPNGEENLFLKMKLKGHSVDHKQCSSQTVKKETYNVALKTSLFLVCVFYCLPITAIWMELLLFIFCLFVMNT